MSAQIFDLAARTYALAVCALVPRNDRKTLRLRACHSEPVTDVTGVGIRNPKALRGVVDAAPYGRRTGWGCCGADRVVRPYKMLLCKGKALDGANTPGCLPPGEGLDGVLRIARSPTSSAIC